MIIRKAFYILIIIHDNVNIFVVKKRPKMIIRITQNSPVITTSFLRAMPKRVRHVERVVTERSEMLYIGQTQPELRRSSEGSARVYTYCIRASLIHPLAFVYRLNKPDKPHKFICSATIKAPQSMPIIREVLPLQIATNQPLEPLHRFRIHYSKSKYCRLDTLSALLFSLNSQ
jgi:hypothetical protein